MTAGPGGVVQVVPLAAPRIEAPGRYAFTARTEQLLVGLSAVRVRSTLSAAVELVTVALYRGPSWPEAVLLGRRHLVAVERGGPELRLRRPLALIVGTDLQVEVVLEVTGLGPWPARGTVALEAR